MTTSTLKTLLHSSPSVSVHIQTPGNVRAACEEQAGSAPAEWLEFALRCNPSGPLAAAIRAQRKAGK